MIRRKALFKVILIITALCLGTPSEADKPCMWCDDKVSTPFMDCLTLRISNNPNFKSFASAMEEMKNDLLTASKVMKNNGPTKENVMKGALAFPLAGLIDADENPDAKLSYIIFFLNQCYQNVNKIPDRDYIDELVKIIKDILKEKRNLPNAQQPESETQSDEIPQAGQNISPSQENNYSPQQTSAADPNQEQNQWNVLDVKTQQQGQNYQPNPSQGSANNFALRPLGIPYGTFQQPPGLINNGYFGSANQNQPSNPLYTYNQGNPYAYPNANQKYLSNPRNSNPGARAAYRFYRYYEPQSNKRYIPSYAGSSAAYYDPYDYSPNNPASNQKPSLTNIYNRKLKRKSTDSPQIKPDSYDDKPPGTWQLQNQKKQSNTNDNSNQSPDDKPISYDKVIKNEAYKKDDQSYVDDKTDYSVYDDNNQPPNYKPVNIKQKKGDQSSAKSTDSDDDYYDGSYDCDEDDYDRDGEDDSWNSNGEDSNFNLRDDLGFSKKKQNPGTLPFQNQKNRPNINDNSDQSPEDKAISYDKLIKNKDDQSNVDDKTDYSGYDDNNQPPNYKAVNIKQKKGDQSSAKSTDSDDDYYDGSYDCDDDDYDRDGEDENKQEDKYHNIFNINGDDPTTITKSKEPKRQKNKSPQYLPEFDKDEDQEITTLQPHIGDDLQTSPPPDIDQQTSTPSDIDQQTSTLPDIDQKTTTAAIIQNTLKGNDKKKVLSADAPVLQPNISDNIQKLDFKKTNHSESDNRVKILKKWALDCIKNGKFDYNTFSLVIVGSMKSVQQTHPDWNLQKSQTTVLVETIFALTQLLLKSNIKEVKDIIQQPQKTVEPVKLPPNIQQSNQNVPQKNQNPNYQSGQANENSQPGIQDKPPVDYSAHEQFIAFPPQNKKSQNNWGNNQNPYPLMQNTLRRQPDYVNTNPVPPQAIPIPPQSAAQDNSWKISDQNNLSEINNNPGFKQNGNQGQWNNAQSRATASSTATQNAAQGNNWNTGNQKWQNKLPQRNGNNANFPQFGKQPSILGQVNTYQGNRKWGDKTSQTVNSNVGVPDSHTFQYLLGYQDNWPGLKQNPSFSQNGVQGNWDPTPNGSNSPSLLRNGNPGFIAERGNGAFIPNGPRNPSFMQNGYQRGNQGIGRVSQTDNSLQRYQWNRKR